MQHLSRIDENGVYKVQKRNKVKGFKFLGEMEKNKHNILYLYHIILSKITWNNYILNTKITLPFYTSCIFCDLLSAFASSLRLHKTHTYTII